MASFLWQLLNLFWLWSNYYVAQGTISAPNPRRLHSFSIIELLPSAEQISACSGFGLGEQIYQSPRSSRKVCSSVWKSGKWGRGPAWINKNSCLSSATKRSKKRWKEGMGYLCEIKGQWPNMSRREIKETKAQVALKMLRKSNTESFS